MSEKISQLVDNELGLNQRDAVFDQIINSQPGIQSWQRYHLIGNVIRDEISIVGRDLSGLVAEKLTNQPTILAPMAVTVESESTTTDVWKSVGLFAVAASLALVAVIALNPLDNGNSTTRINQNNQLSDSSDVNQFSREFEEMLVNHSEFTASSGLNGLIAYAKLVSDQRLDQ